MKPVALPLNEAHARDVIRAILSDPEFVSGPPDASVWERISAWLNSLALRAANAAHQLPSWLTWVIFVWMSVTLLAILVHTIYTLFAFGRATRASVKSSSQEPRGDLLGIRHLDFERVLREALAARDARDFSRAVRYCYAAAILWLDKVAWLTFETSKTNYDYLRELADRPVGKPIFARMTGLFEKIAYGADTATEDAVLLLFADLEMLRHESSQRLAA